jgi:putative RNA 2'-phosphotransferase
MNEKEKKNISKFLSLVLPETIDINLDKNGWASTAELIEKCQNRFRDISLENIKEVVQTNDKQRFALSDDAVFIRANQGHSLETVELDLDAQVPPDILYHGTAEQNLASIREKGIEKRSRQYVHLSADVETATKVGSRHGKVVVLKIDTKKMVAEGLPFYKSENGVWLTDNIHPTYILF